MALGVPTTTPVVGGTITSSGAPYQSIVSHVMGLPVNNNLVSSNSAKVSSLDSMSEREFADYEMREAHKLGLEADSSKYQRAYSDIVKAGLNPRLLLQSGTDTNMPTASSSYGYSQSKNESKSQSSSNSLSWSALAVGLMALAVKLL